MPFISRRHPSIQLGLLKSIASSHGFPITTFHLNLDFARQIDPALYDAIAEDRMLLLGDWLFSAAAFGDDAPETVPQFLTQNSAAIERLLAIDKLVIGMRHTRDYLLQVRNEEVPRYLDRLMETVAWQRFAAVGFTSTFQQNIASFALAARIKGRFPNIKILFGGANFDGDIGLELVRTIQCIDYAIIGEGDLAFPELLIELQEGGAPEQVPGVVCRRDGSVSAPVGRTLFANMDELPVPDYAEYFDRAEKLGLLSKGARRKVRIPFESARGCWWGQKHQCVFCGLNSDRIAFRSKSPARLHEELRTLARHCRSFHFDAVDSILDASYLKTFLSELVQKGIDYTLFFEIKANLTREQLKLLRDSGVSQIQPGIESLNSHVLQLMNKGVTAIQNVNTLRWGRYYDVNIGWNILYGFPGETIADYERQEETMRQIVHLQPPVANGRIWMERFSPIFVDRESFPARYVRPWANYRYIYPEYVDLERVAYFFEYEFADSLPDSAFAETDRLAEAWRIAWKRDRKPSLTFWATVGFLQIEDLRNPFEPGSYTFEDPLASIYTSLSDRPLTAERVKEMLSLPWPTEEIEAALEEFCARGLMMRDGHRFLSLALPSSGGR